MELWDLYDSERRPLQRTHRRGIGLRPGEYHIAAEIWTVNSSKKVLVTLRDAQKETYPGKWESTGGAVLSGETSKQAAVRELFEETGISAKEEELTFLGTHRGGTVFVDCYLLIRDIPVSQLTMQKGETVDAKWVTLEELDGMIADKSFVLPVGERYKRVCESLKKYFAALFEQ